MRTIPSASTRRRFDSFELLRGAAPKPQFFPTVDPITTGPTDKLREFGKRRREAGERRAGHTGPINEHGDKGPARHPSATTRFRNKLETTEPPETGGELPLDAYVELTAPRRFVPK